jgi:predicted tellurium resistance membrane protein TerC
MRKTRLIVKIATGALIILLIIGVVLQLTNENDATDTIYEIIAFSVGIIGMIMAVVAQIGSVREQRDFDKMERNIREILESNQTDLKISN